MRSSETSAPAESPTAETLGERVHKTQLNVASAISALESQSEGLKGLMKINADANERLVASLQRLSSIQSELDAYAALEGPKGEPTA